MRIKDLPPAPVARLRRGTVIPAQPLALDEHRRLDERRQRALTRYYIDAGAGGIAVGVHTTQFEIRRPEIGLFEPVLRLVSAEIDAWCSRVAGAGSGHGGAGVPARPDSAFRDGRGRPPHQNPEDAILKIAGLCGRTPQAEREARLAVDAGYHAGLLSLAAFKSEPVAALVEHCRAIGEIIPLIGFYLQPAVGGRVLEYEFWRRFAEIENVLAIKIAPFNRYQTLDVVRAVCEAGREQDIALYTGNDDTIVLDLLSEYRIRTAGGEKRARICGGLLGHWSVWTRRAVEQLERIQALVSGSAGVSPARPSATIPPELLTLALEVTDANAAFFDAAHGFSGCIPGLHEVLRRQGLLKGTWCLNPSETLSPGQAEEIERVYRSYPYLNDDAFVAANLERWLAD